MRIEKVNVADLIPDDEFIISADPDPELHKKFLNDFPGTPSIIVDQEMTVISGYDSYYFLLNGGEKNCNVLVSPLDKKEALFLAYNSRALLKSLSLYEKLNFLKSIIKYSEVPEIYRRTGIGIRIDKQLISFLPELTGENFRPLLSSDLISLRTAVRLCPLDDCDRDALIALFSKVRFSNSNELNLIDMAGDICFRDKISINDVFKKVNMDELFEKREPGPEILLALSRIRYPAFSDFEKEWKREVKKIKLPFRFTIQHYPFFEKNEVELRIFLDSIEKAKEISEKLKD